MTPSSAVAKQQTKTHWVSPVAHRQFDRSPELTAIERATIGELLESSRFWGDGGPAEVEQRVRILHRLRIPLREALAGVEGERRHKEEAIATFLRLCGQMGRAYWGWSQETWHRVLTTDVATLLAPHRFPASANVSQYVLVVAYLLDCLVDINALSNLRALYLARKVFGRQLLEPPLRAVREVVAKWGYAETGQKSLLTTLCQVFLLNRSPYLEDLTAERLDQFRQGWSRGRRGRLFRLRRALVGMGILDEPMPLPQTHPKEAGGSAGSREPGAHPEWHQWVERWEATSTLVPGSRQRARCVLLAAGRWLQKQHPEITSPQQWDRNLAIAYVAAVDRMRVGDYAGSLPHSHARDGQPLKAGSKASCLNTMRAFFSDLQEWCWIPIRFDPRRALATPPTVKAQIGPAPRTIAADLWAKLLWAGLNLTAEDFVKDGRPLYCYPIEMLRAMAVVWLFAGLRCNEILRLRVGCVRRQEQDTIIPESGEMLPKAAIWLLDVPVNKTGTAFTKPVDPLVGQAISAWERIRPQQPALLDRKTGNLVHFLFCYRATRIDARSINGLIIPTLCRKAGISMEDIRGKITSHRARATIASQLFNAREPMTLFELQAWLGHRSPRTTQHYVAFSPIRLGKAYADAGYLAHNLRAIEVLVDRDAAKSVAAATGGPWRCYDLGHGLCTYEFFEQCSHRMACQRCDFYAPKESSREQLLQARAHILRLAAEATLTEEERAAIDLDVVGLDRLLSTLSSEPAQTGDSSGHSQIVHQNRPNCSDST